MSKMIFYLCFVGLFTTALCQQAPPAAVDLLNIFYNGFVPFKSCSETEVLLSNINYILYTQQNLQNGTVLNSTNLNAVNPNSRIIFIIHGWFQSGSEEWIIEMKNAYLNQISANVIIVDWSYYSLALYGTSFCAVPEVGKLTGDLIHNISLTTQIDLKNIQINGFSLGGHIAGYAGQEVKNRTDGAKIGRINGLEPAGAGYSGVPIDQRLDASDALFVQGIHTSNWQIGYTPAYATADFEVNYAPIPGCGAKQSGCPLNPGITSDGNPLSNLINLLYCNHLRAAAYFLESITSNNFIATKCDSCTRFGLGLCRSQPTTIMGENCPSTASGIYYLNINSRSPFARGDAGVTRGN